MLTRKLCKFVSLPFAVDVDRANFEIDPDGGHIISQEGVVREPDQQGALPHPRVADDEQLEQVIVIFAVS